MNKFYFEGFHKKILQVFSSSPTSNPRAFSSQYFPALIMFFNSSPFVYNVSNFYYYISKISLLFIHISILLILPPSPSSSSSPDVYEYEHITIGVTVSTVNQDLVANALQGGYNKSQMDNIYRGNYSMKVRAIDRCEGMLGMSEALTFILNNSVDVIFGAYCTANCISTAQAANYYDVAYFPLNCFDPTLDNSTVYSTVLRFFGSLTAFSASFAAYFQRYQWKNVAIMSDGLDFCNFAFKSIQNFLRVDSVKIAEIVQVPQIIVPENVSYLMKIRRSARIIIFCHTNYTAFQQIMYQAQDFGMTDPAQYVWITFFNIYLGFPFNILLYPWLPTNSTLTDNYRKQAFYALKIVSIF
ncbi:hypothetical protein HELRODRAFT_163856 [Helobdella robusta]|uniref:Receptor ligand binding region domain-containing protein n=1 Tax=Helobdella robusta TaxID=6412 RepID=T1EUJ6_HELRO|nr:hypothetical protein HELRODRAFT_163856 [Helobdella robusta]ESN96746.1 hypothetical protein HELRODRAFT_163856 [Helobdella robusta]